MTKQKKSLKGVLKDIKGDYQETVDVANAFLVRNVTDYAIKTYERSRKIFRDNNMLILNWLIFMIKLVKTRK